MTDQDPTSAATPQDAPRRRSSRLRRILDRIPFPRPRSRRGAFILFVLIAGFGAALTAGAVSVIAYTDTTAFCGSCHTMAPEIKGYEISAHRNVACVECHTEPGLGGWFKAKLNGTRQLIEVIAGTFPTPIPAPDHNLLPSTEVTCKRCHNVDPLLAGGGPIRLVLHDRYALDPVNTRQSVALVVRPNGFGSGNTAVGVHWHIDADVEYLAPDPRAQEIDYVSVRRNDGSFEEFIASRSVTQSDNVGPDIASLSGKSTARRMDCIDCHNRVGHRVPTIDQAVDQAMESGKIDPGLPYVKQQAVLRLSKEYATLGAAEQAIDQLRSFYSLRYPLVADGSAASINGAIAELKRIYSLVATPEMLVGSRTYPDNLGHTASPGCLRCHDGAHYKVVNGAMTDQTIPSTCATCHTFPQIGPNNSAILIGQRPDTHNDRLWVFNHKTQVSTLEPSGTSCGVCHTRTYCENCHNTPAVQVPHDEMVYNHAEVTRQIGGQACTLCHQPTYCAQCHVGDVMTGSGTADVDVPSPTSLPAPPTSSPAPP